MVLAGEERRNLVRSVTQTGVASNEVHGPVGSEIGENDERHSGLQEYRRRNTPTKGAVFKNCDLMAIKPSILRPFEWARA